MRARRAVTCAVSTGAVSESAETCRWSSSWRLRRPAPLPPTGPCTVRACPRDRTSRTLYCEAHQYQLRLARHAAGGVLDEEHWQAVASPVPVRGQVSLRGLPAQLAAEVLFGVQQRTRDGLTTRLHVLRALVEDLRRSEVTSLDPRWQAAGPMAREKGQIGRSLARYVRAAAGDTATETAADTLGPGRIRVVGHADVHRYPPAVAPAGGKALGC